MAAIMADDETITLTRISDSGTTPDSVAVPRTIGSLTLIREIGNGAMGVVWLGHDKRLDRDVAVKFLLTRKNEAGGSEFDQLVDGARAAAKVRHPGLNTVHLADVVDSVPYLVMEYIDGPTLRALVRRDGPQPLPVFRTAICAVADAVAALHEQNIVHRDIKTANVLVDSRGRISVTDFGLACVRSAPDSPGGSAAGTPAYMAPEMFDGAVSLKSDVYALGIMAYELLTGVLPFRSDSMIDMRTLHRERELDHQALADRNVPAELIDVLLRATHKNPVFRYRTAAQFVRALTEVLDKSRITAAQPAELLRPRSGSDGQATSMGTAGDDASAALPGAVGDDEQSPATYFDRISMLAKERRITPQSDGHSESKKTDDDRSVVGWNRPDTSSSSRVHPSPPGVGSNGDDASDFVGVIKPTPHGVPQVIRPVPCIGCKYLLVGLTTGSNCPECRAAVVASLQPDRLIFAPAAWLQRVALGQALYAWSIVAVLLSVISKLSIKALLSGGTAAIHPLELAGDLVSGLSLVLLLLGAWLMTTPESPEPSVEPGRRSRRSARVLIVLVAVFALVGTLADSNTLGFASPMLLVTVSMMTAAQMTLLANQIVLANRLGAAGLRERLRRAIAVPIAILIVGSFVRLAGGFFGGWSGSGVASVKSPVVFLSVVVAVACFFLSIMSASVVQSVRRGVVDAADNSQHGRKIVG